VEAAQARRGICGDYAESIAPAGVDSLPHRRDFAYHFVAEDRGRLDHLGMIAALPNFEVGAIGKSETHTKQDFVSGERRDIDFFETQVLAPIKNGRHHL
jgi:hypothetical protein